MTHLTRGAFACWTNAFVLLKRNLSALSLPELAAGYPINKRRCPSGMGPGVRMTTRTISRLQHRSVTGECESPNC